MGVEALIMLVLYIFAKHLIVAVFVMMLGYAFPLLLLFICLKLFQVVRREPDGSVSQAQAFKNEIVDGLWGIALCKLQFVQEVVKGYNDALENTPMEKLNKVMPNYFPESEPGVVEEEEEKKEE